MIYQLRFIFISLIFTALIPAFGSSACSESQEENSTYEYMKPVIKDGRYYYPYEDLVNPYNHLGKIWEFFGKKVFCPTEWGCKLEEFFGGEQEPKTDVQAILNPIQSVPKQSSIDPIITWIGHATVLIQISGYNILTDPVFGDVKFGPIPLTRRRIEPGVTLDDLPSIHAIVISHNHSDHTDTDSLMALAEKFDPIVYVPEGNRDLIESMGFSTVIENTWWDSQTLGDDQKVTITCVPAYHWSMRFSFGSYRASLWSGWMISALDTTVFFAGDTAYGSHFTQIAHKFPKIDVALLPIGPTEKEGEENHHLREHIDAIEAVQSFADLNAQCFVPIHYGTFFAGKDTLEYPLERLQKEWRLRVLSDDRLLIAQCGKQYGI